MANLDPDYTSYMNSMGYATDQRSGVSRIFYPTPNFIYLYHTKKGIVLPSWPDNISDSTSANFSQTTPLGRSAPIYSYTGSGPRTVGFQFQLHRDMLEQTNANNPTLNPGDDYVEVMAKEVQAAALPNYGTAEKMVDPPLVAVKIGNEIFIKGVIVGAVQVSYSGPIMAGKYDDKYAIITIGFTVYEVDPYDAEVVQRIGSYRSSGEILMNTSLGSRNPAAFVGRGGYENTLGVIN